MNLDGQAALVTGAGTGIGREVTCALVEKGMRVALIGRRMEKLRFFHIGIIWKEGLIMQVTLKRQLC